MLEDTIAAVATPPGTGGVAIVRVSGPDAGQVARRVFSRPDRLEHARMAYGSILADGEVLDTGYAVLFNGPRSYTGEDTLELHVHGGAVGTRRVLEATLAAGARLAEPGEFTKRAFLNGRMDLSQAQGVGDLIGALSNAAATLAIRQASGSIRDELAAMQDDLTDIIAQTEAELEYPEEDIQSQDATAVAARLLDMAARLEKLAAGADKGATIRNGLRVTLAGAANAGKSSLFNRLCGYDRAIVTDVPGTTRDLVDQVISIRGAGICLSDTAGMRQSGDIVEEEGVRRCREALGQSQLVLFVLDATHPDSKEAAQAWDMARQSADGASIIQVWSKADLAQKHPSPPSFMPPDMPAVRTSARTGEGIDKLCSLLYERSCADVLGEETVLLSDMRQKEHVSRAAAHTRDAARIFSEGLDADCACIDLRGAWQEIGCVTGNAADERIIDRIFSKFCLGK